MSGIDTEPSTGADSGAAPQEVRRVDPYRANRQFERHILLGHRMLRPRRDVDLSDGGTLICTIVYDEVNQEVRYERPGELSPEV